MEKPRFGLKKENGKLLGISYMSPQDIKENHEIVKAYYDEEDASPIVKDGHAAQLVREYVPNTAKILECGLGTGSLFQALRKEGYRDLHGADIDNYLTDKNVCDLKTLDFSFEKLPWPDATFDAIITFETIEHIENPYHFIREMRRVIKPDGVLILSMPNVQHIFNKIFFFRKGDMPRWRKNNGHLWVPPRGVFAKAFMRSFELREKRFYKGFFPYRALGKLNIFPANERFGHTAIFIFKPI